MSPVNIPVAFEAYWRGIPYDSSWSTKIEDIDDMMIV
jgi:hypothetical protein